MNMNRDYDWSPPKNDIRNIPPKVQEKYKKEDTRYLDDDKDNINNYRNEYSERFYNNAARNIPITPKRKSVPKYIIIFLLLVSFVFICLGLNINISIIIFTFLFIIIIPIYILYKKRYITRSVIKVFMYFVFIFIVIPIIYDVSHNENNPQQNNTIISNLNIVSTPISPILPLITPKSIMNNNAEILKGVWHSSMFNLYINDDKKTAILESYTGKSFYYYTIDDKEIILTNTDGISMRSSYKILNSNMIEINLVGIKIVFDRVQ